MVSLQPTLSRCSSASLAYHQLPVSKHTAACVYDPRAPKTWALHGSVRNLTQELTWKKMESVKATGVVDPRPQETT